MTARITERTEGDAHVIRLEGQLVPEDARLVERMFFDARERGATSIVIDLQGLTYLDESSAVVLRALRREPEAAFRGCCLFNERLIEDIR